MAKTVITAKQRAFVEAVSEDFGKPPKERRTLGELALHAGYSKETSETPAHITKTKAVAELFEQHGLTKSFIIGELKHDLELKRGKENRTADLSLAGKWLGLEAPSDSGGHAPVLNIMISESNAPIEGHVIEQVSVDSLENGSTKP